MIISIPLSAFANTPNFSSQDSTINKTKLVLKDQVKNTDGIVKTIEVYENAEGRTVYTRKPNGNVELMLQTKFIEGDLEVINHNNKDNILNGSSKLAKTSVKNFYYNRKVSYAVIITLFGAAISTVAFVSLIYLKAGATVIILSTTKRKAVAKFVGTLALSFGGILPYTNSHGAKIRYYQYQTYVLRKGKKVKIRKTKFVKLSRY